MKGKKRTWINGIVTNVSTAMRRNNYVIVKFKTSKGELLYNVGSFKILGLVKFLVANCVLEVFSVDEKELTIPNYNFMGIKCRLLVIPEDYSGKIYNRILEIRATKKR